MAAGVAIFGDMGDVCVAPLGRAAPGKASLPPQTHDATTSLERIVKAEIGPKLALFHHDRFAVSPAENRPTRNDIERLAMLVIGTDEAATVAHFEKVCAQEHSYSTLLAYFVAPAARFLGELWTQDVCDFLEVTIGVGRLQAFMDRLVTPERLSAADVKRRALLIALPGDTHVFGARMVAKVLEATGWDVTLEEQLSAESNARTVAAEWIGVVGLSLSVASRAELAAKTISVIRSASLNRRIAIMAGGSAITENPELALQIGADAVGLDAPTAAVVASHLLIRQAAM
jgi:methanogenic corrinoid protein MtbC1